MIGCDRPDGALEWFHFECVGIMIPQRAGDWVLGVECFCFISLFESKYSIIVHMYVIVWIPFVLQKKISNI